MLMGRCSDEDGSGESSSQLTSGTGQFYTKYAGRRPRTMKSAYDAIIVPLKALLFEGTKRRAEGGLQDTDSSLSVAYRLKLVFSVSPWRWVHCPARRLGSEGDRD